MPFNSAILIYLFAKAFACKVNVCVCFGYIFVGMQKKETMVPVVDGNSKNWCARKEQSLIFIYLSHLFRLEAV